MWTRRRLQRVDLPVEGLDLLQSTGADSLVTAVRAHRFLWSVDPKTSIATAKNYEPLKRPRRQDWNGELIENGAFYLTRKAVLQKLGCLLEAASWQRHSSAAWPPWTDPPGSYALQGRSPVVQIPMGSVVPVSACQRQHLRFRTSNTQARRMYNPGTAACMLLYHTRHGCRLGGKMVLQEMAEHTFTELDSLVDWEIVAGMSQEHGFWPPAAPGQPGESFSLGGAASALPSTVSFTSAVMGAMAAAAAVCALMSLRSR